MAKVLVVDDEEHIRRRYSRELSEEGYEVETQDSGGGLVQRIDVMHPDVVILDIRLGDGWDGLDLLQDIKNRFFELPVILCTAYDTFKYDPRSAAADNYVVKSESLAELKGTIKTALGASAPDFWDRMIASQGMAQQEEPLSLTR